MGYYANSTNVSPEKTQNDIRDTLRRYGANKFGIMEEDNQAHVMFEYNKLLIQLTILLAIKAKLEAIECGISTLEKEFMAFVVMPDGRSLGDHIIPQLEKISSTGKLPKLLSFQGD